MKRTPLRHFALGALALVLGLGLVPTSATTGSAADRDRSVLTKYALAKGVIHNVGDNLNPSMMRGVLGVPSGPGPFPVAVILHGAAPSCIWKGREVGYIDRPRASHWALVCADPGTKFKDSRAVGPDYAHNEAGMSYLVQALVARGFVAVSIDVAAAEAFWVGEPDADRGYTELVSAHLRLLKDLNAGDNHGLALPDLTGRIDTSRVALVGHSRGGAYVLSPSAARRMGLFAAVAIEPAINSPARRLHTVPVLNIRGACDEQVGALAALHDMKALARRGSTQVAIDVLLSGTTHAAGNTNWVPLGGMYAIPCDDTEVARTRTSRAAIAQLTARFLKQALRGADAYRLPDVGGLVARSRNLVTGGPTVRLGSAPVERYRLPRDIPLVTSSDQILDPIPPDIEVNKDPFGENGDHPV